MGLQRRRVAAIACVAISAASAAFGGPECSRTLSLALHDHGLLYSNRTGEGIDKDLSEEMARRSGCKISVTVMPRARIWQLIETGALDFSLSGISNEARDKFAAFAWTFANKYYLLVRRDAAIGTVADFERNPAFRLGAIRSFRYGPSANRLVDRLDVEQRVSYSSALDPLYQLLLDGRVHGMIIEPFDYPAIESDRLRERTAIVEFDDPPVRHGVIMSRKSLSPAQQQAWRELIDGMREDGTVRRIFEKYFSPELARTLTTF